VNIEHSIRGTEHGKIRKIRKHIMTVTYRVESICSSSKADIKKFMWTCMVYILLVITCLGCEFLPPTDVTIV
jgi:hypothetical protein